MAPTAVRPPWLSREPAAGTTWCDEVGETIGCTAVSRVLPDRQQARTEAEDAALEALVHQSMVGARNLRAAEVVRQQKLEAFDRGDRSVVDDVMRSRATVARLARARPGAGLAIRHDWWWEEYDGAGGGSELLVFVHLETSRAGAAEVEASYAPIQVSGTRLTPLLPTVGWLFDPGDRQAFLVPDDPTGALHRLAVKRGDIILIDAALPVTEIDAAVTARTLELRIRRGPFYQSEVRVNVSGGRAPRCDPDDPLCGL
jgi:hypothetical protein